MSSAFRAVERCGVSIVIGSYTVVGDAVPYRLTARRRGTHCGNGAEEGGSTLAPEVRSSALSSTMPRSIAVNPDIA